MSAFGVGRVVWDPVRPFPAQAFSALILALTEAAMEIIVGMSQMQPAPVRNKDWAWT